MMENVIEFEKWLFKTIEDAKKKLSITDLTIANNLLNEATLRMEEDQFKGWLDEMLIDAQKELSISDRTLVYILAREGTKYYLKGLGKKYFLDKGE